MHPPGDLKLNKIVIVPRQGGSPGCISISVTNNSGLLGVRHDSIHQHVVVITIVEWVQVLMLKHRMIQLILNGDLH